jgi:hypothetical protein
LDEDMPDIDFTTIFLALQKHIKMIQGRFDDYPTFYGENLSDKCTSIKSSTAAVVNEISTLTRVGMGETNEQIRDAARITASEPLMAAIDDLLKTLEYAKKPPQNPVPNEAWEEAFLNPLKQFANFFRYYLNQELYVITSTEDNAHTLKTTHAQIKAAHATHKDASIVRNTAGKVVDTVVSKKTQRKIRNIAENAQHEFRHFMADDPNSNVLPSAEELKTKATNAFTGLKTGLGKLLDRSSTPEEKSPDETSSSSDKPLGPGESRDD